MSTHMWTHGASRRGRRMSLELPQLTAPGMTQGDSEFLQSRPDLFYPYNIPAALMGRLFPKVSPTQAVAMFLKKIKYNLYIFLQY